jgi:enoyl-[acyl-carrier protein] reductase II
VLRDHIQKCKKATDKSFGVNVALLYPEIEKIMNIIVDEGVKIVFTSAGNPSLWTPFLKKNNITVVHVISSSKFAKKSEDAGCDAVVAEGFEAGGHNGREETTTMCLVPLVCDAVKIPVIAAGGIASGMSMLAAFALGAEGVQVGTRFAMSKESSLHENFKNKLLETKEGDTVFTMKQLTPVRLIKNKFYEKVKAAEERGASVDEMKEILGRARAKKGMFEGDLDEGELEIGQIVGTIKEIKPAEEIVNDIWQEFKKCKLGLLNKS